MQDTLLKEKKLTREFIEQHSRRNNEPQWMLSKRLRSLMIYDEAVETKKERMVFPLNDIEKFLSSKKENIVTNDVHIQRENRSGVLVFENGETKDFHREKELTSNGI
ncbi:MAG: hypothetical protein FJ218_11450, partial [Ignavibacteria bacterium]|nr:hypothetical protein [Ignavibacteria bacterium]